LEHKDHKERLDLLVLGDFKEQLDHLEEHRVLQVPQVLKDQQEEEEEEQPEQQVPPVLKDQQEEEGV
jgi:hypothetical protein